MYRSSLNTVNGDRETCDGRVLPKIFSALFHGLKDLRTREIIFYIPFKQFLGLCTPSFGPYRNLPINNTLPSSSLISPFFPIRFDTFSYFQFLGLCTPFFGPLPQVAHHQHTPLILLNIPLFSHSFRNFHISFIRVEPKELTTGSKVQDSVKGHVYKNWIAYVPTSGM
jgi:hypothetical protein